MEIIMIVGMCLTAIVIWAGFNLLAKNAREEREFEERMLKAGFQQEFAADDADSYVWRKYQEETEL